VYSLIVFGRTPLREASYNGHTEVVKVLLAVGADTNQATEVSRVFSSLCSIVVCTMPALMTVHLSIFYCLQSSHKRCTCFPLQDILQYLGYVLDPDPEAQSMAWHGHAGLCPLACSCCDASSILVDSCIVLCLPCFIMAPA